MPMINEKKKTDKDANKDHNISTSVITIDSVTTITMVVIVMILPIEIIEIMVLIMEIIYC